MANINKAEPPADFGRILANLLRSSARKLVTLSPSAEANQLRDALIALDEDEDWTGVVQLAKDLPPQRHWAPYIFVTASAKRIVATMYEGAALILDDNDPPLDEPVDYHIDAHCILWPDLKELAVSVTEGRVPRRPNAILGELCLHWQGNDNRSNALVDTYLVCQCNLIRTGEAQLEVRREVRAALWKRAGSK